MNDENDKPPATPPAPPAPPKPRPKATWGFACGGARVPCKTFRIVDGVSRRLEDTPELPAPKKERTDG
jgi:hypothetical protein